MLNELAAATNQYCLHGLGVELDARVASLAAPLARFLDEFRVSEFPPNFSAIAGQVQPFDGAQVMRHVSPDAVPVCRSDQLIELFQQGERFWMVDDRWGIVELNLLRGVWRSWVVPTPTIDATRVFEMAVMWPMAQLLRGRGLHLLPAASVARNGWAGLFLCPFGIGPELESLVRSGYRLLGQRWTALREEDGRLEMLHMPGQIERSSGARLRMAREHVAAHWTDLEGDYCGVAQHYARCDDVIVIDSARRSEGMARRLSPASAINILRKAWPIAELNPGRRWRLAAVLAHLCACYEVRLSQTPQDLLGVLDTIRNWPLLHGGRVDEIRTALAA